MCSIHTCAQGNCEGRICSLVITVYVYQNIVLYAWNLYSFYLPVAFNKSRRKKSRNNDIKEIIPLHSHKYMKYVDVHEIII